MYDYNVKEDAFYTKYDNEVELYYLRKIILCFCQWKMHIQTVIFINYLK